MSTNLFEEVFKTFKKSAFRLEKLEKYHIEDSGEWKEYQDYLNGIPLPNRTTNTNEWIRDNDVWEKEGKEILRVRVIPNILTNYLRYEIEWGYPYNIQAGEEVKFILQENYKQLIKNQYIKDFWLFDDKKVLEMRYSDIGEYIGVDLVDDKKALQEYLKIKEVLIKKSIPSDEFYTKLREQSISFKF